MPMFALNFLKSIQLDQIQQPLLKNALLLKTELVVQCIYAVRIPGGLTPPWKFKEKLELCFLGSGDVLHEDVERTYKR